MKTKQIIMHQVNCKGVMGAGFAKYVKEIYPDCYKQYLKECKSLPSNLLLGTFQVYEGEFDIIINMFTQENYGREACYTDYQSMENVFKQIRKQFPQDKLIVPYKIGCGLAGGDWNIVSEILKKYNIQTSKNIVLGRK